MQERDLLSGEHFSVDGPLIQAWGGHKSCVPKDDDQASGDGGDFKGKPRSNDTHESKTDADARLYRKGKAASELRYIGHTLSDNRHGLIASAVVTTADGYAEREAAKVMISDARQALGDAEREVTLGADKGYDVQEFTEACVVMNVTPHLAQNKSGRKSALPEDIAKSDGYALSQRKLIEQGFGWAKTVGGIRPVMGARHPARGPDVCADRGDLPPGAYAYLGTGLSARCEVKEIGPQTRRKRSATRRNSAPTFRIARNVCLALRLG